MMCSDTERQRETERDRERLFLQKAIGVGIVNLFTPRRRSMLTSCSGWRCCPWSRRQIAFTQWGSAAKLLLLFCRQSAFTQWGSAAKLLLLFQHDYNCLPRVYPCAVDKVRVVELVAVDRQNEVEEAGWHANLLLNPQLHILPA